MSDLSLPTRVNTPIPTGGQVTPAYDPFVEDEFVDDPFVEGVSLAPLPTERDLEDAIATSPTPDLESARVGVAFMYSKAFSIPPLQAYNEQDGMTEVLAQGKVGIPAVFEYLSDGLSDGEISNRLGEMGYKKLLGDQTVGTDEEIKRLNTLRKPESEGWKQFKYLPLRAVRMFLEQVPLMRQGIVEGGTKGLALGGALAGTAAIAGLPLEGAPGLGTVGHAATVAGAFGAGVAIGTTQGTLENIFRKESGGAFLEFSNIKDATGKPLSPNAIRAGALAVGTINTWLETLQISKLFPGLKARVQGKAIAALTRGAFSLVKDIGEQTLQEGLQESSSILIGELLRDVQEWTAGVPRAVRDALTTENLKAGVGRVLDVMQRAALGFGAIAGGKVMVSGAKSAIGAIGDAGRAAETQAAVPADLGAVRPAQRPSVVEVDEVLADLKDVVESAAAVDSPEIQQRVEAIQQTVDELQTQRDTLATSEKAQTQAKEFTQAIQDDTTLNNALHQVQAEIVNNPKVEVDTVTREAAEASVTQEVTGTQAAAVREQWATEPIRYRKLAGFETEAGVQGLEFAYNDRLQTEADQAIRDAFTKANKLRSEARFIKGLVRTITGQTRLSDLIQEPKALTAAFKKAEQGSKAGMRAGKSEQHAAEMEIRKRIDSRRRLQVHVARVKQDLIDAIKDTHEGTPQGDAIRELIEGIDLVVKRPEKTLNKLRGTREFLQNNPDAELPDYVLKKLEILDKIPLGKMTLDDIDAAHDAVLHQVHLAKTKDRIRVALEERRAGEVLAEAIGEMKDPPKKPEIPTSKISLKDRLPGRWLKRQLGLRSNHFDLIVEELSGPNSTMDKVLYQEIKKGIKEKDSYVQSVDTDISVDLNKVDFGGDIDKWRNERVVAGGKEMTRGERIEVYLNSLNENNRRSMLEKQPAFASKRTDLFTMTEEDLDAIVDSLTPDEKTVANAFRKGYKKQGSALSAVHYKKNGFPMRIVEEYAPKNVNTLAAGVLDADKTEILEQLRGKWIRLGVPKGMLIERTGSATPLLIRDAFQTFAESVDRAGTYIGLEIPMSNASKLLYDKTFHLEMEKRYGKYVWREIETGLRDIAGEYKAQSDFVDGAVKQRGRLTKSIFMLNPFPTAKVVLAYPLFGAYVSPADLGQGLIEYAMHPKEIVATHKLNSSEFRKRVERGYSRDISEVVGRGTQGKRLLRKSIGELSVMRFIDRHMVSAGMQGAVNQAHREFKAGHLSPMTVQALDMKDADIAGLTVEQKVAKAYQYADYVVERTQDMSAPEHQSAIQRGDFVEKAVSMYSTSTNQMWNLGRRMVDNAKRTGDYGPLARTVLVLGLAMMGNSGINALRDAMYKRKNRASLIERAASEVAGLFYLVRDIVDSAISYAKMGYSGYDISSPPLRVMVASARFLGNTIKAIQKGSTKTAGAALENFIELTAILTGKIPYTGLRGIYRAATGGK